MHNFYLENILSLRVVILCLTFIWSTIPLYSVPSSWTFVYNLVLPFMIHILKLYIRNVMPWWENRDVWFWGIGTISGPWLNMLVYHIFKQVWSQRLIVYRICIMPLLMILIFSLLPVPFVQCLKKFLRQCNFLWSGCYIWCYCGHHSSNKARECTCLADLCTRIS